jgi:NodT family efflux transporter outer membrane factor (OMF) lipoprotein
MRFLVLLFLLTGCHAFVPEPAPQPRLPDAYRLEAGEHALAEQWWKDLGSPELDALMDEAFRSAPDLRTALARLEQAQAAAAKSGAALWPSLTGGADAAQSWSKDKGRNVVEADAYGLSLAASYELDLWGRVRSLRTADALEAAASREDLRAAVLSLSGEIAQAWISLCSARQQLAVLRAQQRTNIDIESVLTLRFSNSLASALDILQQREAVAEDATRIVAQQAEVARLENRLNLLLGKAPGTLDLSAARQLPEPLPLPRTGLPADLLENRPDIRASWQRLLEAGWDVAAARADRMPALRLTGRFEQDGNDVERIFDNWLASLAAALTAPLFDGGSRSAEVRRQEAVRAERLAAYEKTVFTALSEVDTGVNDVLSQFDLLAALDVQLSAAQSALESARVRYQNGVLEYDTVLSLLLKVQNLERLRVQEQASLLTSQTGLCRALGRGWRQAFPDPPQTIEPEAS